MSELLFALLLNCLNLIVDLLAKIILIVLLNQLYKLFDKSVDFLFPSYCPVGLMNDAID